MRVLAYAMPRKRAEAWLKLTTDAGAINLVCLRPAPRPAECELGRVQRMIRSILLWLNTPDDLVGWLPFAVWRGYWLGRQAKVGLILASGPPFTTVLIGALLKRLTGWSFVADFRDAWVNDRSDPFRVIGGSFRAPYGRTRIRALEAIERFCLSHSDLVVFTSTFTRNRYCHSYPFLKTRSVVILNGAEEEDFVAPPQRQEAYTFTYIGSLHEFQLPQLGLFLRALREGSQRSSVLAASRVLIAGSRGSQADAWLRSQIVAEGLLELTTLLGDVRHEEAVAFLKGSGAILLFVGENCYPRLTKVTDAAAVKRPVLAFASEGAETALHIRTLGQIVYSGTSAVEVATLLESLATDGWSPPDGKFPFPYPHHLNWRAAAKHLASLLDRLPLRAGTPESPEPSQSLP
jgi:glycosyltransferase involved in cell wall biosynthesis